MFEMLKAKIQYAKSVWDMQVSQSLREIFQVSIILLILSRMTEIQTASVHSGWGEARKDGKRSLKTFLIIKKNQKKSLPSQMLACDDAFTNLTHPKIIFSDKEEGNKL